MYINVVAVGYVRLKLCAHRHTAIPSDDFIQNVRVRLSVFELLYTLNCAVRLLPLVAKAYAAWLF